MQTFDWSFGVAETADASILATIAGSFAYLLVPIVGVLSWHHGHYQDCGSGLPDVQPLYAPCFAAIGAMNSEMKSGKWVWAGIGLQLGVGYSVGYLVYTIGTLITAPASHQVVPAIAGAAVVLVFAAVVIGLIRKTDRQMKAKYALSAN